MRLMRKGFNFSLEEITEAVKIAHGLGKKVYVTVNNLLNEGELEEAEAYLRFLESAGPDAIIVQDFAVLSLVREMGLNIKVHSSVMMNVHNVEMVRALQEMGVTRVVTSREMDLMTTRYLQQATGMELEYFVHGDMCSVHGANCYFSSMVFGMSSNRGKCLKPCRWDYRVKKTATSIRRNTRWPSKTCSCTSTFRSSSTVGLPPSRSKDACVTRHSSSCS